MQATSQIHFPPFRLDLANESVWRGTQETVLRPKTFAVLRYKASCRQDQDKSQTSQKQVQNP